MTPTEIKRTDNALIIRWSDGKEQTLSSEALRKNCPCAFCKEKRGDESHSKPIIGANNKKKPSMLKVIKVEKGDALRIEKIWAVGNYAIGILWGDEHSDGIWGWDELKKI